MRAMVAILASDKQTSAAGLVQLVVLSGPRRSGKTTAACRAIAERGGVYTTAHQFTRPGLDLERVHRARVLVIDDTGDENLNDFGLCQIGEAIKAVCDKGGLVVACTKEPKQRTWEEHYEVEKLLAERGAWVAIGGQR
jgi:hypothetical protein